MDKFLIIIIIFISFFWGLYPILYKYILSHNTPIKVVIFYSGIFYALFTLFYIKFFPEKEVNYLDYINDKKLISLIGMLVLFCQFIPAVLYSEHFDNDNTTWFSALTYTSPLFTALLAYYFWNENINNNMLLGILLIIGGGILVACNK